MASPQGSSEKHNLESRHHVGNRAVDNVFYFASFCSACENKAQRTATPSALRASASGARDRHALLAVWGGCLQASSHSVAPSPAAMPSLPTSGSWEKGSETSHLRGVASSLVTSTGI